MTPRIFHLRSIKKWLKRKRKAFSSPCRRYQQHKSCKSRDSISIASGEPITDDKAWQAPKTRHDSFDDSSSSPSSWTQTLVQSNDSRSASLSENTSCLEDSQRLPSPTQDTQSDRSTALSFLEKTNPLRSSPEFSIPEKKNQVQNPRDSPSLATTDNQPNHPQDPSPAASNSQPGVSHAISLESDGETKSCISSAPSCKSQAWVDGLVNLPYTLFLQIFCLVPPHEIVRSRRVSKALRNTLTSQALCMSLILDFFPRAREARILRGLVTGENCSEIGDSDLDTTDWATVFARLARRYWHLSQGKPWRRNEIVIRKDLQASHGVKPWNRLLQGHNVSADFHHWDPFWTCAPDQGLIIYPAPNLKSLDLLDFWARDIETGDECVIPFQLSGGSLVRVHVSDGVLLFAFVVKSDSGCRFFIEAFDIIMKQPALPQLNSRPNNNPLEKRLSQQAFLSRGPSQLFSMDRPLGHEGRFFCTHNSTHFALYKWIPTTDLAFTTVNPLEELIVWDIGSPRQGPRPEGSEPRRILTHQTSTLQHLGLSQNFTPRLRNLELDNITQDHDTGSVCGHVYLVEDDHDLLAGPHTGPSAGVGHCVQSTGIPLSGIGPAAKEMCLGKALVRGTLPSFDAYYFYHTPFTTQGPARWQRRQGRRTPLHDSCSRRPQCWRHENFPYITVSQAHDTAAGVRFMALQFFRLKDIAVSFPPGIYPHHTDKWEGTLRREHPLGNERLSFFSDGFDSLMAKGRIYGDERWLVGEDIDGHLNVLQF
ncbi:hypothetical protein CEP54_011536 [Fusarium duplospermum]|uniref:F-box domain-containing protein n=1 Tax=Fusarium duplospermum TaxID=1325734 RepID=A0A428PDS4_9HYPO|nr:hypothetical protein CEP54_011536 [Fusarium duplospermum]